MSLPAPALLIVAGWRALAELCRVLDRSSTLTMLHLCAIGMLAGFIIDTRDGRFALLAALCTNGDRSLLYWMQLHWNQLPAMHVGMVIGSLLAMPIAPIARLELRDLLMEALKIISCIGLMLAGMNLGMLALQVVSGRTQSSYVMLAGMGLGMVWSLALSVAVFGALRPRLATARLLCDGMMKSFRTSRWVPL